MKAVTVAAQSDFIVETVSDYRTFVAMEQPWNSLVEEAGIEHPFVTHQWVRTWWECFGAGKQLHILVAKRGGQPVGIAPLMMSEERIYGIKLRQLGFIYNVHTPRFDSIVARSSEEAYRALWAHLSSHQAHWDLLLLCQLPAGSETLEKLPRLAARAGFLVGLWDSADSPYLPLYGQWESYFRSLKRKHRSNLRRGLKLLNDLGPVELEVVSPVDELGAALEEGLGIEGAAWKGKTGTAISSRPETRLFYTRLVENFGRRGWIRLQFLKVQGKRIAFGYCVCYRNKLYLLKPGYNPQYARYSPFNLLVAMALRHGFEEHLSEYDFLGGAEEWKLRWTTLTRRHYWLFVFRDSVRARLVHYIKFGLVPRLRRKANTFPFGGPQKRCTSKP